MQKLIKKNDIKELVSSLNGWSPVENNTGIKKTFKFRDFNEAFSFMKKCAHKSEKMNHHPEWSNIYNVVRVKLTTHDSGGLTSLDISLAKYMNQIEL
jgi:4a-hydroxytetrahydrobiopterin dehydratase